MLKEKFRATDLAAEENSEKIMNDLKYIDYLYSERIQETAKVNTLLKTSISKTLHRFQRYCKQKYRRCKEKIDNPDMNYFSKQTPSQHQQ